MKQFDKITDLSPAALDAFDDIIDVRSPSEFAEDHVPGAINLPVLDDAERAEIGEIYVQVSAFLARKRGAALVARNIARHLETALADKPKPYRPLIYCWRGGMRSGAMATILASIGWRVSVIDGGYRSWRRCVVAGFADDAPPFPVVLIDGQTGSAKTDILLKAAEKGAATLDLEGAAHHRGSIFGGFASDTQPSQKAFETRLWNDLQRLDADGPVLVEAESRMIGRRRVPDRLWRSMQAAAHIEISAPPHARAEYLVRAYADLTADPERLLRAIDRLKEHHARTEIDAWRAMAHDGAFHELAEALMTAHYDPLYARSRKKRSSGAAIETLTLDRLDAAAIDSAAERIAQILPAHGATMTERA